MLNNNNTDDKDIEIIVRQTNYTIEVAKEKLNLFTECSRCY
jgi:hypothetical protein